MVAYAYQRQRITTIGKVSRVPTQIDYRRRTAGKDRSRSISLPAYGDGLRYRIAAAIKRSKYPPEGYLTSIGPGNIIVRYGHRTSAIVFCRCRDRCFCGIDCISCGIASQVYVIRYRQVRRCSVYGPGVSYSLSCPIATGIHRIITEYLALAASPHICHCSRCAGYVHRTITIIRRHNIETAGRKVRQTGVAAQVAPCRKVGNHRWGIVYLPGICDRG